jgi:hypothetical protein
MNITHGLADEQSGGLFVQHGQVIPVGMQLYAIFPPCQASSLTGQPHRHF